MPGTIVKFQEDHDLRAILDKMLTQLKEYFGKMSRGNKIRLAILSAVIVILAIVTVSLLSRTNYVTMYTAQDQAEAGDIHTALKEMNIPVKIEGTKILVPEDRVSELQATIASQGIVGANGRDISIMQGASGFAVTENHANKLYEAQCGADIRASIITSPKIQNADVLVSFGETSPFRNQSNAKQAMCSVMLTLVNGVTLTNQEAQTIAEYVRSSVPGGISYENISIIDNNLNYYKAGDEVVVGFDSEMNYRVALQNRLTEQYQAAGEQLVSPIFGISNVKVKATIRLNFDRIVTESVEFDPPVAGEIDGIVRSASELWEAQRRDNGAEGIPGTDSNAMGTMEYPYGSLDDNEQYGRILKEKNYEINETRTIIEQEQGKIEYLSVAVLVNSDATDEDYSIEVGNLISAGLGIDPANVKVESAPFHIDTSAADELREREEYEARVRQRELIQTIIMWVVILILGLALMVLIRTIVRTVKPLPEPEPVLVGAGLGSGMDAGIGIDYIADDEGDIVDMTEDENIELQTKPTGLEQIEKFIDQDPAAVAQLLRNWLSDDE